MKRMLALFLAAAMVWTLAACGSKGSLSEKLGTLPEETAAPETPVQPEPLPGNTPDPKPEPRPAPEPDQPAEPSEPAESLPLARQLEGVYWAPVENTEENERIYLDVRVIGDRLSLELGNVMGDRDCYSFWAFDCAPEDLSLLQSTEARGLQMTAVEYSVMQGPEAQPPRAMTLALTEDGPVVDGQAFRPSDTDFQFHTAPAVLAQMSGLTPGGDAPQGRWYSIQDGKAVYLEFEADGTLHWYEKALEAPMAVYEGIYQGDADTGLVQYVTERVGFGQMPYQGVLAWTVSYDGSLTVWIDDTPERTLWPVPDTWTMDPSLDGRLTEQISEEQEGGFFHTPYVNGPTSDALGISQLVLDQFGELVRVQKAQLAQEGYCEFPEVHWGAAIQNGILSLRVWANAATSFREYNTWFYDLETETILTTSEALTKLGIRPEDFTDGTRAVAEEFYVSMNSQIPEDQREAFGYDYFLDQTLSPESIHPDMMAFFSPTGILYAVVPIGTMAGAGYYYTPLAPDF